MTLFIANIVNLVSQQRDSFLSTVHRINAGFGEPEIC